MRRRRAAAGVALAALAAAGVAPVAAGEARRAGEAERATRIALEPLRRGDVERLEIETRDVRLTRPGRRAISDLLVEIEPARGSVAELLSSVSGRGPAGERRLFRLRLSVVSAGRLIRDTLAWCGGFDRGLARCEVDCEGGGLALRRLSDDGRRLSLVIGAADGGGDDAGERGVRLSACRGEGAAGQWLVPKGAPRAEIDLSGE